MRKGIKTQTDLIQEERKEKNLVHLVNYIFIITAIIFGVFEYFFVTVGPWGEEEHFLTKYLQAFHILFAALFVFAIGAFFKDHIYKRIVNKVVRLRFSGMSLFCFFIFMTLSGYMIQVLSHALSREVAIIAHLALSGLWAIFYVFHHFKSRF